MKNNYRKAVFLGITLLIPVIVLGLLEASLRLFGFGEVYPTVIKERRGGKEVYVINRALARRYFGESGTSIPEPQDDSFEIEKSDSTTRIFCLGESTMAGFPYEYNGTAPAALRDILTAMRPGWKYEVVNVGMSAVSSFVIEDVLKDLMAYQPDLVIVYSGHNEFYGIYGAGSSVQGGQLPWLTRTSMAMREVRIYQLMRKAVGLFRPAANAGGKNASLMEQMVGEQVIPLGSREYTSARSSYEENIRSMIVLARDHHVPILFSGLVCNLRDQAPFVSSVTQQFVFEPALMDMIASAESSLVRGDLDGALAHADSACHADSGYARARYAKARTLDRLGRYGDAAAEYAAARDLDGLRFRATGDFTQVLQSVCASMGVIVAPVESVFCAYAQHGTIGGELITEHLHPTIAGYRVMARTWAASIVDHHLVPMPDAGRRLLAADSIRYMSTTFDEMIGQRRVAYLKAKWPFVPLGEKPRVVPPPASPLDQIAEDYVRRSILWSQAKYRAAELYAKSGRMSEARDEVMGLAAVAPYSYDPWLKLADIFFATGDYARAEEALRKSLSVADNALARINLAIIFLERKEPSEAIRSIDEGLARGAASRQMLQEKDLGMAYYFRAVAYGQLGQYKSGLEAVRQSLKHTPASGPARQLEQQLVSVMNMKKK
jgi:tetratricopeptide (TPR) repeat protein